ncbi:MAG TPA: flagellar FliJ family protein [Acidimicrobiales bacterium]|nr:flagellar FliJ family protein [Acidimicrobiales bacterium]
MKRYRFRLETVLRVRRLEEDAARAGLLAANQAVAQACAVRDRALAHYRGLPAELGPSSTADLRRNRQRAELAAAVLRARQGALDEAAREVVRAREQWMEAASRVKVLERLDQRRREEHRLEAERAETRFLDDVGARSREDARVH